jgi:hypothetical protein
MPLDIQLPKQYKTDDLLSSSHNYLNDLCSFIQTFSFNFDYVAVNFYLPKLEKDDENQRMRLKEQGGDEYSCMMRTDWFRMVETLSNKDFFKLILELAAGNDVDMHEWPSDLVEFIQGCKCLSLPSHPIKTSGSVINRKHKVGMSSKKCLEVSTLASLIAQLAPNEPTIIDLGSGQGYLSTTLASIIPNSLIVGLEASSLQYQGSLERKVALEQDFVGKLHFYKEMLGTTAIRGAPDGFTTTNLAIEPTGVSLDSILDPLVGDSGDWTLIGLHTCGDLTPNTFRLALDNPRVKQAILVGCCYNLLSESPTPTSKAGFPLYCETRIQLGPVARTVACQAVVRWGDASQVEKCEALDPFKAAQIGCLDATLEMFHRHHIRCLLQYVLFADGVLPREASEGKGVLEYRYKMPKLKSRAALYPFSSYVRTCFKRLIESKENLLKKTLDLTDEQLDAMYDEMEQKRRQTIWQWTLRSLMGRVIESLIVMDRVLFLHSQPQVESVICQTVWDGEVSPRNISIAIKKT